MNASSRVFWGLFLATLLLYLPISLSGEFIWDDPNLIEGNKWTGSFSNIGSMFTQDLWASTPLGAGDFFYYRPVMLLSLTLDQALGLGPMGHHLHSLFWHLLCIGLLLRLARELEASPTALFVGVSLFALHPLQTEVLAHVAARNDAMATAGLLGALVLLLPRAPSKAALIGAAGLTALAVFSKESAYLAPLMLWSLDRVRFSQALNPERYAAVLLPLGLALGLRLSLGGTGLPAIESVPIAAQQMVSGIGFYLESWLLPWGITPTVSTSEMSIFWPTCLLAGLLLAFLFRASGSWGRWGFLLALIGFLPALPGLLLTDNTGFRYVYLPMAGLSIALVGAIDRLPRPTWLMVLPLFWFSTNAVQLSSWGSDRALWSHAYNVAPGLQSACGLFKSIETQAREEPLGETRDRLFQEAEPWLARALEPPTQPYCCLSASRWMWERNQNEWMLTRPEPAIRWGSLAVENGCPKTAELMVPLAASHALAGDWSLAESQLNGLTRDPFGLRDVVLAAAGLHRDDRGPLEQIAGDNLNHQRGLEEKARMLMSASENNARIRGE